jgi:hypothetical protein
MTQILRTFLPLRPTQKGLRAVQGEEFKQSCRRLLLTAFLQNTPEEQWQSRLRVFTLHTLLPKRSHNLDDCETYYKAHFSDVDSCWSAAVRELYSDLTRDAVGTIQRELGIKLPAVPEKPSPTALFRTA